MRKFLLVAQAPARRSIGVPRALAGASADKVVEMTAQNPITQSNAISSNYAPDDIVVAASDVAIVEGSGNESQL